ncbi:MAG TPA: hypothetical protein V6D17_12530 [Candidatus Obscuribacterales bacterium]
MIRKDEADVIYKTEEQKYISVIEEICEMHEIGRPVLVGTTSIEKSELVADFLSKPQKMNEVLLKKMHKTADIIKRNNLSGPSIDALKKVFERPGLVDVAKLEEICRQLEVDFPKKQEELLERAYSMLRSAKVVAAVRKGIPHHVLNAKHHEKEAMIVAQAGRKGAVTVATNMAGRGTDILLGGNPEYMAKEKLKKENLASDDPAYDDRVKELTRQFKTETDKEHDEVVALGGLHIVGTERHEARRIDNQLRGRAGRQGDPGSTRFFLSLEDQLMRIFGGEKIARLMEFIKADEEMPIESGMVTRSIENAQKKVEAHHFDMRKHVLQYDDVLSTQREVIYRERRRILERADLKDNMLEILDEHVDQIIQGYIDPDSPPELWEEEGLPQVLQTVQADIPMLNDLTVEELAGLSFDDLRTKLIEAARMAYDVREQHIGADTMRELERQILLSTIDSKWVDYLHNIDLLREGIHLRGYGQRDPLQEYKREAFDMFNRLMRSIKHESVQLVFRAQPVVMDFDGIEGMIMNQLAEEGSEDLDQKEYADLVDSFRKENPDAQLQDVLSHLGQVDSIMETASEWAEESSKNEATASVPAPAAEPKKEKSKKGEKKGTAAGKSPREANGAEASADSSIDERAQSEQKETAETSGGMDAMAEKTPAEKER